MYSSLHGDLLETTVRLLGHRPPSVNHAAEIAGAFGLTNVVTALSTKRGCGDSAWDGLRLILQVIPEGAGPVKTNLCGVLVCSASFLVLAGRVEVGVGVKAWAEPDRVAAGGP